MKPADKNNQYQIRFLKERAQFATRERRRKAREIYDEKCTPPANVIKAKAIVKAWERAKDKKYYAIERKRQQQIDKDFAAITEIILFGTPQQALAAVRKFEQG